MVVKIPKGEEVPIDEEPEEEEKGTPSLEELKEIVKGEGVKLWYDRHRNQIRIRVPGEGTISIPYSPDVFEMLKRERQEAVMKRRLEKKSTPIGRQTPVVSDIQLWNTSIKKSRPLIESLIAKVSWLQDALLDVGMQVLLFTFLISKEADPEKIVERIEEIKDKDKFVNFIMSRLIALYQAAEGYEDIVELRDRVVELEAENAILEESIKRLRQSATAIAERLNICLNLLDRDAALRYARIITIKSLSMPHVEVMEQ